MHERPCERAIGVQSRVEYRNAYSCNRSSPTQCSQYGADLISAKATMEAIVHSRHLFIMDNIGVQVEPEPLKWNCLQIGRGPLRGRCYPEPTDGWEVENVNPRRPHIPRAGAQELVVVAEANRDAILIAQQWPAAFEVGEERRAAAGGEAKLHVSDFARGRFLRGVEIGVAIEEREAEAPAAPQGEQAAEQNATVAAEHERRPATLPQPLDCVGEPGSVRLYRRAIQELRGWVTGRVVRRCGNATVLLSQQPFAEPRRPQRFR
jgi:hypothetical protein